MFTLLSSNEVHPCHCYTTFTEVLMNLKGQLLLIMNFFTKSHTYFSTLMLGDRFGLHDVNQQIRLIYIYLKGFCDESICENDGYMLQDDRGKCRCECIEGLGGYGCTDIDIKSGMCRKLNRNLKYSIFFKFMNTIRVFTLHTNYQILLVVRLID